LPAAEDTDAELLNIGARDAVLEVDCHDTADVDRRFLSGQPAADQASRLQRDGA
jgi:hypothetical protein